MNDTVLNETEMVSLEDAIHLIVANPNVRYFLRGEPGIGKTSIALALQQMTGTR
jgi:replication-associated recombination protein RarA